MARKIHNTERAAEARLAARKAVLDAMQKQLCRSFEHRAAILVESASEPGDCMKARHERDIAVQQLDHETRLLHDVTLALKKVQRNAYGRCEKCERAIPDKRLDAMPSAHFCITCQSKSEELECAHPSRLRQTA